MLVAGSASASRSSRCRSQSTGVREDESGMISRLKLDRPRDRRDTRDRDVLDDRSRRKRSNRRARRRPRPGSHAFVARGAEDECREPDCIQPFFRTLVSSCRSSVSIRSRCPVHRTCRSRRHPPKARALNRCQAIFEAALNACDSPRCQHGRGCQCLTALIYVPLPDPRHSARTQSWSTRSRRLASQGKRWSRESDPRDVAELQQLPCAARDQHRAPNCTTVTSVALFVPVK